VGMSNKRTNVGPGFTLKSGMAANILTNKGSMHFLANYKRPEKGIEIVKGDEVVQ